MKKNLLIMASAVMVLASCSSEEPIDVNKGHGIEFRTSVSRASETTLDSLKKFNVTAEWNGDLYFDQVTYKLDDGEGGTNTFKADMTYYWPGDGEVKFYAYAPINLPGVSFTVNNGKKLSAFTPDEAIGNQIDFITANATGTKAVHENKGVDLNFYHRLSQIEIKAKKTTDDGYTFKIMGVRIGKVCGQADYDFESNEWTLAKDNNGKYTKVSTYTSETFTPIVMSAEPQFILGSGTVGSKEGSAMVIPQQLVKWVPDSEDKTKDHLQHAADEGSYISVLLNITRNDGKQIYPFTSQKDENGNVKLYAWAAIPVGTNWLMGKKYVYTLNFDKGAGFVDPDDPNNPDEPILGPISFNVEIQTWGDPSDEPIDMDPSTK